MIGTIAGAIVKQREIDRTAVQNAVENADTLPDAYDDRQQQVHDAREVAGQITNVGWHHAGRMPDEPLIPDKHQAAKQQSKQRVDVDPRFQNLPEPGTVDQAQNSDHNNE